MSQLTRFVNERGVDNVVSGTIVEVFSGNPSLAQVEIPGSGTLLLTTAEPIDLFLGLSVLVAAPAGDLRRAYIKGKAAVLLADEPVNKVLGLDIG